MLHYLSQLIGRPVVSATGARRGVLRDLAVSLEQPGYPPLKAAVTRDHGRDGRVDAQELATLDERGAVLRDDAYPGTVFTRRDGELLVRGDLWDRRVIDVRGGRVVQVFDAAVGVTAGEVRLVGVDVGVAGLFRRLGPRRLFGGLKSRLLDWSAVALRASTRPWTPLRCGHDRLAPLPPPKLASIVEDLPAPQAAEVVAALDDDTAARTLEQTAPALRTAIVLALPPGRAAALLDAMAPAAVAAVLERVPREQVADLVIAAAGLESAPRRPDDAHEA